MRWIVLNIAQTKKKDSFSYTMTPAIRFYVSRGRG